MSEGGERAKGHRPSGPNPGPYPWPGPGPGSGVADDADFRRPHLRQHHSLKRINIAHLYDRQPTYERFSKPRDTNGGAWARISSATSSALRQDRQEERYLRCRPLEDTCKTLTKTSTLQSDPRNNALSTQFCSIKSPKDRDNRKICQESGRGSVPEKLRISSRNHNTLHVGNHNHLTGLKRHFKQHSLKQRDAQAFPVSVHPVQPPNLRCKSTVNKESVSSYMQILSGKVTVPESETRSQCLSPDNKPNTKCTRACAETSNPDIKVSNVDEACATIVSYIEPTASKIAGVLRSDHTVQKTERISSSHSLQIDEGHFLDETAEYPLIGRHCNQIRRVEYTSSHEVHFTAPEAKQKMERYFPTEEDSIKCSIQTCGMSSSIMSGGTLEHEMTPSEKLARVLPRRDTPQIVLSAETISSLAEEEVIEVHNPVNDRIGIPRKGKFLHCASFTVSGDPSYDEYGNFDDENFPTLSLRNSCNESDHNVRSQITRILPQDEKVSDMVGILQGADDKILHANERNLSHDTITTYTDEIVQDMRERFPATERLPHTARQILGKAEKISSTNENICYDVNNRILQTEDKTSRKDERVQITDDTVPKTSELTQDMSESNPHLDEVQVYEGNAIMDELTTHRDEGPLFVDEIALAQTDNASGVSSLRHQTNDSHFSLKEARQIRNFSGQATEIIDHPYVLKQLRVMVSKGSQTGYFQEHLTVNGIFSKTFNVNSSDNRFVHDTFRGKQSQAKICDQRRSTVPQISRDNTKTLVHLQKEGNFPNTGGRCSSTANTNKTSRPELSQSKIIQDKVSAIRVNTGTDPKQEFELLENLSRKNLNFDKGLLERISPKHSGCSINAECQVSFATNTEGSELAERGETVSRTFEDEVSTNGIDLVCSRRTSHVNFMIQSRELREKVCQTSLQTLGDEIQNATVVSISQTKTRDEANIDTLPVYDTGRVELAQTNKTLFTYPGEEIFVSKEHVFPGLKLVQGEISVDSSARLNIIQRLPNENSKSAEDFQSKAFQDELYQVDEAFLDKFTDVVETSGYQISARTLTDEENVCSDEYTSKTKTAQDESYLTTVFRRNSNDLHSSQEILTSIVQSKTVSGKSSATHPSGQISTATRDANEDIANSRQSSQTSYKIIQDENGLILKEGFNVSNHNNYSCHSTERSDDKQSPSVQYVNSCDLSTTELHYRPKVEDLLEKLPSTVITREEDSFRDYNVSKGFKPCHSNQNENFEEIRYQNELNRNHSSDVGQSFRGLESLLSDVPYLDKEKDRVQTEKMTFENSPKRTFDNLRSYLEVDVNVCLEKRRDWLENNFGNDESARKGSRSSIVRDRYSADVQSELQTREKFSLKNCCTGGDNSSREIKNNVELGESLSQRNVHSSSDVQEIFLMSSKGGTVDEYSDQYGGAILGKPSVKVSLEPRTTCNVIKSASITSSKLVQICTQEITEIERRHTIEVASAQNGSTKTECRGKIEFDCHELESQLVGVVPSDLERNTKMAGLEKTESSKDQSRDSSICVEMLSNTEESVSVAEQLSKGNADTAVSEENMTAKSVAELTDEDAAMPHDNEKRSSDNVETVLKKISLDDNTLLVNKVENMSVENKAEKKNDPSVSLASLDGTTEDGKTEGKRCSVKRSSSGVQIVTFHDSGEVGSQVKVTDLTSGIGKQMTLLRNQVVMDPAPQSCSQMVSTYKQLSPYVVLPDDGVMSYRSMLSLETIPGATDKGILKSGGTSRGSERLEWTMSMSVNDENGLQTQRSVDIITLNDTTKQFVTERQSNVDVPHDTVESPEITDVSMTSCGTRVLMLPSSCHSAGTNKEVSEVAYDEIYKTQAIGVQSIDNKQTRTKLTKKRGDRDIEGRKRAHLVGRVPWNILEREGNDGDDLNGRKKSSMLCGTKNSIRTDDYRQFRPRKRNQEYACDYEESEEEGTRFGMECNCGGQKVIREVSLPVVHRVASSNGENNFQQYRSISGLYVTRSDHMASDFRGFDYDEPDSSEQSVSPSLLNLGRFTPSSRSSWSTLRYRPTKSSCPTSNVIFVPSAHSRNNKSSYLHLDEDLKWTPRSRESKRRPRRSDGFPSGSPEQLRFPVFARPGRNMYTEAPGEEEAIQKPESGAACLKSCAPEANHGTRVVTFENIPSPRSTLRRSTLTPRGESVQTFDDYVSDSYEDATQQASKPHPGCSYAENQFLEVSRLSSDASGCCLDDLSSAAQMSRHGRWGTAVTKNRYYEEIPFIFSHESIHGKGRPCTMENTSAERIQNIWPKTPRHLSPPRSPNAVENHPATAQSHPDLRMLTASKTTLLSLAEAGVHSPSRLSSPTPSDIPSPPPYPSQNRLPIYPSQTKVDVAVGIRTLDCDPTLFLGISESALPTPRDFDDNPTTLQIPVSPTSNRRNSFESPNAGNVPIIVNSCVVPDISNTGESLDNKAEEAGCIIPIFVSSNIYLANLAVSRGVGVTTDTTDQLTSSTPWISSTKEEGFQRNEQLIIGRRSRGTSCYDINRFQIPATVRNADSETTSSSKSDKCMRKPEETTERNEAEIQIDDSINATGSTSNEQSTEAIRNIRNQRPVIMAGHYRFGSTNQRNFQYSDLIGDITEVNTAVPSRSSLSRSSGHTNRLSPNVVFGSHSRIAGTRGIDLSRSRTGADSISDIIEPRGCHREKSPHAQKPRPVQIKRPADASCKSCIPNDIETSNVFPKSPDKTNQEVGRSRDSKRPLPPAALDQSEEGYDSNQGAGSFSNAGVITDLRLDFGRNGSPVAGATNTPIPEASAVHFSGNWLKPRTDSGCTGARGQSICLSTPGTGSMSYTGAPSYSIPSTTGRSIPDSVRESTGQDVSSLTQGGSTPSAQPPTLMDQQESAQPPLFGSVAHCGVICPEINRSNSQPKHKICVSIKSSNSGPFSRTMLLPAGSESYVTRTFTPDQSRNQMLPSEVKGSDNFLARMNDNADSGTRASDTSTDTRRSRGTLASQDKIRESVTSGSTVRSHGSHGPKHSRSSSQSIDKRKSSSSHKSVQKTGSKTKRGSVPKHVIRAASASSKTIQPKTKTIVVTVSSSAVDATSNPPLMEMDEGSPQDQVFIPWVTGRNDEDEEDAEDEGVSYIAEVSETTENIPIDRLESECLSVAAQKCQCQSVAAQKCQCQSVVAQKCQCQSVVAQQANADFESVATETCEFTSEAYPKSFGRGQVLKEPSVISASRSGAQFMAETSEVSPQSDPNGASGPEFFASGQDVAALRMTQDESEEARVAGAERRRQLQTTACVVDAICKNVKHRPPGNRNGLYTSRVGYIGPPRPPHPLAATACRRGKITGSKDIS